jgi:two-component system, chemotaxis family, CheB/CheR fusion protein
MPVKKHTSSVSSPAPTGAAREAGSPAALSSFPIVGVGASAGGLEAFRQMLSALPVDTGMAFVLVQHLSPTHASLLSEILSRTTALPVAEVGDGARVEPNHVYVIPPDRNMVLVRRKLQLLPREDHGLHRPIDTFLRSLAEDQGPLAIGVILSGTASDGTLGLEEIKAEGGITFAQDETAQQSSMPQSAIDSGCVDLVLSPEEIARELARIARHPLVAQAAARQPEAPPSDEPDFAAVLKRLRDVTGVDFTQYKPNTFYRRITRRMVLHQMGTLKDYARFLAGDPREAQALYQDILISVTSFFRNPEVFEALKAKVLPELFKDRSDQKPLRVWVPGCSTGEEAYSLAIAIAEHAQALGSSLPVQVFATDLNEILIEKARAGIYPKSITHDVSPERLRRFFAEVDAHFRVAKVIRDECVFARHNLLADPPFSQIDLISCRNLLIYLEPSTQKRVMPLLHYALKPNGFLVLGSSETAASYRDLFAVEDARHKIFRSRPGIRRLAPSPAGSMRPTAEPFGPRPNRARDTASDAQKAAERILLAKYAPPSVVIDEELDILQFHGDTGPYLALAPGKASLNLLKMARDGLPVALRAAISRSRKEATSIRQEGLRVKSNGEYREINLEVIPLQGGPGHEGAFLVLFEAVAPAAARPARGKRGRGRAQETSLAAEGEETAEWRNVRLEEELRATREFLQSVIEQQEAANEELQSASEELQSTNEELQSINEELETSKEEIQSTNEELTTVNEELQNRNRELHASTQFAQNIVATVRESLLVLDAKLYVLTASRSFYQTFGMTPEETVGRLLYDLGDRRPWDLPALRQHLDEVLVRDGSFEGFQVEQEFAPIGRRVLLLNARRLVGESGDTPAILLAIEDVTVQRTLEEALYRRLEDLAAADRSKNEFLALLAHELRNPLAPLRNALNLLELPGADPAEVGHAREIMHRQIRNMTRLIDDLLDVSRITRGTVLLRREPVELVRFLERAVEVVQPSLMARGQQLTLALPREGLWGDADATRLEQVFGNLLNNASKFTPIGGRIELTAEAARAASTPGDIVVRVRDNGIGISPDMLPRVFDLFVQAQRSLDRSQGGLGIGLTLVRSLVELHGGRVEAKSAGLGQGSEFVVHLPLCDAVQKPERNDVPDRPVALVPATVASGPVLRRILVVDDNEDTAESMVLLLRLRGHEVAVAFSGPGALTEATSFEPEIVLLDIGLPGLDGYEVARQLRQNHRLEKALLVALTGYGQEEDRRLAREAGFDHHLTKPVDPAVLYQLLELEGQRN